MKKADPTHEILVVERNRPDDTFGFGVVFSDATLENFAEADRETYTEIARNFAHWDDIDIHYQGQVLTSDGVHSFSRSRYAEHFRPQVDWRPNKFVWLGTTFPYPAFTFVFKESDHGLWRVHAYRYNASMSTFILETTEAAWRRAGLDAADEDQTIAFAERLFAEELQGHRLLKNRSLWRNFPTVKNGSWHHRNLVLIGDAAHTAHFSIGSGTKLAMEDAIALCRALQRHDEVKKALVAYEEERRPDVERLQRAAQVSLEWFEQTERYHGRLEPIKFAMSLLTRSLRVTHDNLKLRDPKFVESVDRWFASRAEQQSRVAVAAAPAPPPMFTPFRLRDVLLSNRIVVSPMCQYSAEDGTPNDWHLVNLGSRAVGGAALVIAEMTDVSREGRISPGCTGMYKPEHVIAWKRIVEFVHANSQARIALQLAHAGRKGSTHRLWEGIDEPLPDGNWPLISASAIPYHPYSQVPKAMDRRDMDMVRDQFVGAARMAVEAGFDMLELHFAHGYLLASFISPLTNIRTDEYGGSLANRMRYPLEVFDAVRAVWPEREPMSVKISATDWAEGGLSPEDAVGVARWLREHGCDIVTVSTGQTVPDQKPVYGRLYQTPFSDRIRYEAGIPTMTVGGIAAYDDVHSILAAGRADLCVLARGHPHGPYLTRHAAYGQGWDLPWPDQYVSVQGFTPR